MIFTAAGSYIWDNVYNYDREFRTHISYYPDRSWAIILQQAWSMCLKDRIEFVQSRSSNHQKGKKEICQRFNRGQCTAGKACKFDHRCLECGKFGHGQHICRQKNSSRKDGNASNGVSNSNAQHATNNNVANGQAK